jgi:hypothetical protein
MQIPDSFPKIPDSISHLPSSISNSIPNPFSHEDPADKSRRINNDYDYYLKQLALHEHNAFYATDDSKKEQIIKEIKQMIYTPREVPEEKPVERVPIPHDTTYNPKEEQKLPQPMTFRLDDATYKKLNAYGIAIKSINKGRKYMLTSVDDPDKLSNIPIWRNASVSVRDEGTNYMIILNVPEVNSDSIRVPKPKAPVTIVKDSNPTPVITSIPSIQVPQEPSAIKQAIQASLEPLPSPETPAQTPQEPIKEPKKEKVRELKVKQPQPIISSDIPVQKPKKQKIPKLDFANQKP